MYVPKYRRTQNFENPFIRANQEKSSKEVFNLPFNSASYWPISCSQIHSPTTRNLLNYLPFQRWDLKIKIPNFDSRRLSSCFLRLNLITFLKYGQFSETGKAQSYRCVRPWTEVIQTCFNLKISLTRKWPDFLSCLHHDTTDREVCEKNTLKHNYQMPHQLSHTCPSLKDFLWYKTSM